MTDAIPYADLGISIKIQTRLESNPPHQVRLAFASGRMCENDAERLGLCVLLSADEDDLVAKTAKRFLERWSPDRLKDAINRKTHPKILEFVVEFLSQDDGLDEHIFTCITLNPRTAKMIAGRANERLCEEISKNKQQLLLNPDLINVLQANSNCSESNFFKVESFLRMQNALPAGFDAQEAPAPEAPAQKKSISAMDLEAEIMAALSGSQSPSFLKAQESFDMFEIDDEPMTNNGFDLGDFSFDFNENSDDFSWDLTEENTSKNNEEEEVRVSMEQKIAQMNVGHKIKLAYKGNKEARGILIRDTNKSVAVAVVKSGRLTDGEVASYAGNRNLADDVIREISNNNEFVRKYPVKVALVNNPKCPPSVAIGFVGVMHKKDLQNLARNRNVSAVVKKAAQTRFKEKYRKE